MSFWGFARLVSQQNDRILRRLQPRVGRLALDLLHLEELAVAALGRQGAVLDLAFPPVAAGKAGKGQFRPLHLAGDLDVRAWSMGVSGVV
jgi:hypothetical protein